jgi:hypothetical protein
MYQHKSFFFLTQLFEREKIEMLNTWKLLRLLTIVNYSQPSLEAIQANVANSGANTKQIVDLMSS